MLSCFELMFLIFGWIFAVKGLVIASLVISSFWLVVFFVFFAMPEVQKTDQSKIVMFIDIVCVVLSIVCLCIRF